MALFKPEQRFAQAHSRSAFASAHDGAHPAQLVSARSTSVRPNSRRRILSLHDQSDDNATITSRQSASAGEVLGCAFRPKEHRAGAY